MRGGGGAEADISLHDSCKLDIWSAPQTAQSALKTFPFFPKAGTSSAHFMLYFFNLSQWEMWWGVRCEVWGDWSEVSGESEEIHNETLTLAELAREESELPHIKSEWSLISISIQTPNLPTGLSCVSPNECFNTLLPPASFCSPSAKKSEQKTHFHLIVGGLTIKSRWTILVVDSCKSLAGLCVMTRWPQIQLLQIIHLGSRISVYWQCELLSWEGGEGGRGRCWKRNNFEATLHPELQWEPSLDPTRDFLSRASPPPAAAATHEYVSVLVPVLVSPPPPPPPRHQSTGWKHLAFFCYFYMKAERGLLWKIIMKSFCVAASIQILFWTVLWC